MGRGSANLRVFESASANRRSLSVLNRFAESQNRLASGSPNSGPRLFPLTWRKPLLSSLSSPPRAISKERFHRLGGGVRALCRGDEGRVEGWLPDAARAVPGPTAKKCSEKGFTSEL